MWDDVETAQDFLNFSVIPKTVGELIAGEQETAFSDFVDNKVEKLKIVEKLLNDFAIINSSAPRTLLFQRDDGHALLLDDKEDENGGIAVCLAPKESIISQDEYL